MSISFYMFREAELLSLTKSDIDKLSKLLDNSLAEQVYNLTFDKEVIALMETNDNFAESMCYLRECATPIHLSSLLVKERFNDSNQTYLDVFTNIKVDAEILKYYQTLSPKEYGKFKKLLKFVLDNSAKLVLNTASRTKTDFDSFYTAMNRVSSYAGILNSIYNVEYNPNFLIELNDPGNRNLFYTRNEKSYLLNSRQLARNINNLRIIYEGLRYTEYCIKHNLNKEMRRTYYIKRSN